jgi:hypothetical protein
VKVKIFSLLVCFLACFISLSIISPAFADTIPVANASFEITNPLTITCGAGCAYNNGPIPGWTISGGEQGSWQPSSAYFSSPVPDGNIVAYSNGGTISQTLSTAPVIDTTYTLSVDVGHRLDGGVTNYAISLFSGSTFLSSITGSNGVIPIGTFADETLTYTFTGVPSGNLGIVLTSAGGQSDFDNVRLMATPTPEPGSLALLAVGLGLTVFVLRRR